VLLNAFQSVADCLGINCWPQYCSKTSTVDAGLITVSTWSHTHSSPDTTCLLKLEAAGIHLDATSAATHTSSENTERHAIYRNIQESLKLHGLQLDASVTQGLALSDLFQLQNGRVIPRLQHLDTPVRAIVAPLTDESAAKRLHDAFAAHVASLVPTTGVWPQAPSLYHTTLWHASPHQVSCPFTIIPRFTTHSNSISSLHRSLDF
jgi:hypothetical protein